ncbi:MAG: hypothetical protein N2643_03240 [Endomicrobia bacterium]|nr:hypothetical protein [Endomicrobiia bacterium]
MTIKNFIRKFKILFILFLFFRYVITSINIAIGCFILSVLLDKIFPLPIYVFNIYWVIVLIVLGGMLVNLVFRLYEVIFCPYRVLQEKLLGSNFLKHKDDVINAYLLEEFLRQPNYSKQLSLVFVEQVLNNLRKISISKITNFDRIIKTLPLILVLISIILILYFLPPQVIKPSIHKILFTRRPDIYGIFISPKNIKVPYMSSCNIKVIVEKGYELIKPELFIRTEYSKKFYKVNFEILDGYTQGKIYRYEISPVETKIYYKIKFRGIYSKVYIVEPILLPEIIELKVWVEPPSYISKNIYEVKNFLETKVYYGSKIKFVAIFNKRLKYAFIRIKNENKKLMVNGNIRNKIFGSFVIDDINEIIFEVKDEEDFINTIKYKINVVKDEAPKIQIYSPEKYILVDKNSLIPVVYEVSDDISVTKVKLICMGKNRNVEKQIDIKNFDVSIREYIGEYMLDLGKMKLNFGDVVSYYLTVYDNDLLFGPKYSITEEYRIEIFSYEKQHLDIQNEIKNFIDKITETLNKEIELKENLLSFTTYSIDNNLLQELIKKHQLTSKNYNDLDKLLSSLIEQMQQDPYTFYENYYEFESLLSMIKNIKSEAKNKLIDSLELRNFKYSNEIQDEIINTLERAAMVAERVMKRQNMQNISNAMSETKNAAGSLFEYLKNMSSISKEDLTKIGNLMKEIEEKLQKIADMLSKNQQNLPEEFINRREVQNLDFSTPTDLMQAINSTISKGDISGAIKLAEQLLRQLENISRSLEDISSDIVSSDMMSLQSQLEEIGNDIQNIIDSEKKIYDNTKKIDDYRIEQLLSYQSKLLEEIKMFVEQIVKKIDEVESLPQLVKFYNKSLYKNNSAIVKGKLESIIFELKNNKITTTPLLIDDSLLIWNTNVSLIKILDNIEYNQLIRYTLDIKEDLEKLKSIFSKEYKIEYSQKHIDSVNRLAEEQKNLVANLDRFISKLRKLGTKSFVVSLNDLHLTNEAKSQMVYSKENLNNFCIPEALQNQNNAINYLLQLKDNFDNKKNALKKTMQQMGKPMGGGVQVKTVSGGRYGYVTGRVAIPSSKDFIPSKEFKEDIIKSLSEKYPQEYKRAIENYYKKILQQ